MLYNLIRFLEVLNIMNSGKEFEQEFKESIKVHNKETDDIYLLRLTDSAGGFGMDSSKLRFSAKSPFDFILHQRGGKTLAVELKSCGGSSFSFDLTNDSKMIKASQVKQLNRASHYGIKSGFIFNFRKYEQTFWMDIEDFIKFAESTSKKSINLQDVIEHNGVLIDQKKKKVHYLYDISILFEER